MNAVSDNPTPAEAEVGAEQARAGLVSTLNLLRENLKPGNMVDEVMSNAKVSASAVSEQIWDVAKRNPLPALMIGAGLALMFGLGQRAIPGSGKPSEAVPGGLLPDPAVASRPRLRTVPSTLPEGVGTLRGPTPATKAADLLSGGNDRFASAAHRGADRIKESFKQTGNTMGDTMASYPHSTNQIGGSLSKIIEDQPLVLAALGIALGAAIGAAIPRTETENSLMGESSASLRTSAQDLVHEQTAQLKSAAQHAVEDIKQTVADHGVTTDNLSGMVSDVADKAKSATYEAGRGLNPAS